MPSIEVVANSTTSRAPGWAYVPDTGYDPSRAPIQPAAGKRNARIQKTSTAGEQSARQGNALNKRLVDLDRENAHDVQISVPSKDKEGRPRKGKTAATRKILTAQKTFQNYIDDEEALSRIEKEAGTVKGRKEAPLAMSSAARPSKAETRAGVGEGMQVSTATEPSADPDWRPPGFLAQEAAEARLLHVTVPLTPSAALMDALVSAPALSYNEARARPLSKPGEIKPRRHFCELCGYWGRTKCLACGARICGLACKKAHDQDRCQRYSG